MASGEARGINRQYQVTCRDVLVFRQPELSSWSGDGIDVPFDLPDTRWTIDVALRASDGALVVAECRRTVSPVKQEDVAAFAYKVELLRRTLVVPVAGIFFTKSDHQLGAVKVGQFAGIQVAVLDEGAAAPGFNIAFLRYDVERERKCRDFIMHIPSGSISLRGELVTVVISEEKDPTEL